MITNQEPRAAYNSLSTTESVSHAYASRRVSWGAVFAGMVIAVVVQLVLSLFGMGIGLSTIDPLRYSTPEAATLGIGAGVWWVVSSVLSLFAGGWVAAHLSNTSASSDASLHGLLTWGLATLVTVYLLSSMVGAMVRGGASVVSKTADVAATGIAAVAGPAASAAASAAEGQLEARGITVDGLKGQVEKLLAQTGKPALQPASIASQASAAAGQMASATATASAGATGNLPADDLQGVLQKIIAMGKNTVDQVDRDAVINVVMAQTGVSRPEAEQRTDAWIKQYQDARAQFEQKKAEAEAKARQVADTAANVSSKAALGAAVALLLGAVAGALGGLTGRRRFVVVSTDVRRPATTVDTRVGR